MKIKIFNKGFNYSQDGRGNRLVIHMQGCNLRCPWCTNPEGFEPDGVMIQKFADRPPCLSCEEMELREFLNLCQESSSLFFDGGGVTFTGGEPTMQETVLKEALSSLRKMGIHTAVETNGTSALLPDMFSLIDQLIMDFKTADLKKYQVVLGHGGEILLKNINAALENHNDLLIRFTLINGFNTSDEDLERFLSFLGKGPKPNVGFEFLCYHEFGREKWRQCAYEYKQQTAFVPESTLRVFEKAFMGYNLDVVKT
jgi:pyruvate formate lyase activating enzyme